MIKKDYRNAFLFYLLKFAGLFIIIYCVTFSIIGLSVPGGYYSSFIYHYLNYVSWLRASLLYASQWALSVFGYDSYITANVLLKLKDGYGVRIVYSCLGYGVMSFWIAFICANKGNLSRKFFWILGGLLLIWLINVTRICLLLLASNKHWQTLPPFDHHTLFNIAAYLTIFILMYFYDRSNKTRGAGDISSNPGVPLINQ
ncbi:MAG: hypothetical protein ABIN97_20405 [Ginsengibacter sp.]